MSPPDKPRSMRLPPSLVAWFDTHAAPDASAAAHRIDAGRIFPFIAIHAGCLGVYWVGISPTAVVVAALSYALRMFAITAFYHRYFSHRAFRAGRVTQLVFAILGASAAQRGPLWWASHHRHHHIHSDQPEDSHSALQHGFLWSHLGWFLARGNFATRHHLVKSLASWPELRFLDRWDMLVPLLLVGGLWFAGQWINQCWPGLGTSGTQWVVWGFCIATVALYHATFSINSLAHCFGSRRYETRDDSRNNVWLALLTFGEGWHNNHHHYPVSARQGFHWWEIDLTYYGLCVLERIGVISDMKRVPGEARLRTSRYLEGRSG